MLPVERLSYSSINTYLLCPKSWEWCYIVKPRVPVSVNLPFGTAFHKTVQGHIVALAEGREIKSLAELWPDCWHGALNEKRNRDNIKWDKPFDYYNDLGKRMLCAPDVVAAIEGIEVMTTLAPAETALTEYKVEFHVPSVSVPIVGYIDLIGRDGVPVDLKTAGRKWSGGKEHSEIQPNFYLLGLNQEGYDLNPSLEFRYIIFTKTKSPVCQVLETSRTWGQLLWTMNLIRETWEAIQAGVFPCNPTGWKCSEKYCGYWPLCRGKEL